MAIVALAAIATIFAGSLSAQAPPPGEAPPPPGPPPVAPLSPAQMQQLVAPIALYPDSLVAQILAAASYPTEIVEAERFLRDNTALAGAALGNAVDQQDWDPSVKALTQFPSVLEDMNDNLSWTSELGDANYNQPQDVRDAIQFMRGKAAAAGNLQSTPQETVSDDDGDWEIEPADPDVVYVPIYNPGFVYGYPVGLWPGFYHPWWGIGGPYFSWGIGINVGGFFGFGWGWNHWGYGWGRGGGLFFNGGRYYSHTHAFYDRNAFVHGNYRGFAGRGGRGYIGGDRGWGFAGRGGAEARGFAGRGNVGARGYGGNDRGALRGFGSGRAAGTRSSAFGGFSRGGDTRGFAARGMSSMHAGGFHGGGGGGFHGGGGSRGGGGRR